MFLTGRWRREHTDLCPTLLRSAVFCSQVYRVIDTVGIRLFPARNFLCPILPDQVIDGCKRLGVTRPQELPSDTRSAVTPKRLSLPGDSIN